jgi:hypothetical protein
MDKCFKLKKISLKNVYYVHLLKLKILKCFIAKIAE